MASEDGGATTGATAAQGVAGSEHSQNFYIFFDPPMKTLLDLLAKFSELAKINKAQKTELEAAFNELPEDSRSAQITQAYNETLAKFSEEAPAAPAADQATPPAGEPEKKVEANEDKSKTEMVSISASELAALRSAATQSKESGERAFSEFVGQAFNGCVFSESNKTSPVLPKHKEKITAFATAIGMERAKEFFEILGELKMFSSQEIGSGAEPEKKPETSEKFSEAVKFYQETMGFSEDEAKAMATDLVK